MVLGPALLLLLLGADFRLNAFMLLLLSAAAAAASASTPLCSHW
jgi:hypothetical protein